MKHSLSFQYSYADSTTLGFVVSPYSLASNVTGAVSWTLKAAMAANHVFYNHHSPSGGEYPFTLPRQCNVH
jgi:hypothetical protein